MNCGCVYQGTAADSTACILSETKKLIHMALVHLHTCFLFVTELISKCCDWFVKH